MAALLLGLAPWLAAETLEAPHLSGPLRVGALVLFFSALNGAQTGALAGFEAFRVIARVNVIVGVASFPILLAGAFWEATGVVWALAINLALHWGLNHIALRREAKAAGVPFSTRFTTAERQILLHFSLPSAANGLLIAPAHWIGRTLLIQEPAGYASLGILTAALSFKALVLFVSGALSAPLLSMISGATAEARPVPQQVRLSRLRPMARRCRWSTCSLAGRWVYTPLCRCWPSLNLPNWYSAKATRAMYSALRQYWWCLPRR